jgi:hypothetical protein
MDISDQTQTNFYSFFLRSNGVRANIKYILGSEWGKSPPEWFFYSNNIENAGIPSLDVKMQGVRYQFFKEFPHAPLSGVRLFLFRKANVPYQ